MVVSGSIGKGGTGPLLSPSICACLARLLRLSQSISVLSSTLGRPGMIPKWLFSSVPLPSMLDDVFFEAQTDDSPIRPDGRPCRMAFFVKAVELYQILDEILVGLYLKTARNEDMESKLVHILEIDSKLQAWNKSLPEHLRPRHAAGNDEISKRQAIVLRVRSVLVPQIFVSFPFFRLPSQHSNRFLHARILLFRPTVICYCMRGATGSTEHPSEPDDASLSEVMLAECSRICLRLAHELVETFEQYPNTQTMLGPLPNWWYSVLCKCYGCGLSFGSECRADQTLGKPVPNLKMYTMLP